MRRRGPFQTSRRVPDSGGRSRRPALGGLRLGASGSPRLPRSPRCSHLESTMRKPAFFLVAAGALLLLPDVSRAQLDVQWVTYTKQPSKLPVAPLAISDSDTQAQFRTGDLNKD